MARTIDLLIASPEPIEDLVARLTEGADGSATPTVDPGAWDLRFGEVATRLATRGPDGAGRLPFGGYAYVLTTEVPREGVSATDGAEIRLARRMAQALAAVPGTRSLLVVDAHYRSVPADPGTGDGVAPTPA